MNPPEHRWFDGFEDVISPAGRMPIANDEG
jgi:hypothetical protein